MNDLYEIVFMITLLVIVFITTLMSMYHILMSM